MENVIHRLTLDLARPGSGACLTVRRGDSARTLVVTLSQGGRPYRISDGVTAVFYARKSDGVPLFNSCAIEQNIVRYDFTGQTTNVAGPVDCEIRLYGQNMELLTSAPFEVLVEDTIQQDGDIPDSSPEYTALTELVSKGSALVEKLDGMEEELLDAAERATNAAKWMEQTVDGLASREYVDRIAEQIRADMAYEPIAITGISVNPSVAQIGEKITRAVLSWTLNAEPVRQSIDALVIDPAARSYAVDADDLASRESFELTVVDARGAIDRETATIRRCNGVYYGALESGRAVDNAAVLSLTRRLQEGRGITFDLDYAGKRPVYACPVRYGTPTFVIGGFNYDWAKVTTLDFTNSSGYTESYDVWMHGQDVAGSITVTVR